MVLLLILKMYMGTLRSHCDDYCGLPIGNLAPDTVDPRVVQMSAFGTKRTSLVALHFSGVKRTFLLALQMSAFDPKQTSASFSFLKAVPRGAPPQFSSAIATAANPMASAMVSTHTVSHMGNAPVV